MGCCDACALLPDARVTKATGEPVVVSSNRDQEANTATCGYVLGGAFLYTWPKGSSFRIVAARGGGFVSLDGQNVKEKAGEFMVRDVFVALERTDG